MHGRTQPKIAWGGGGSRRFRRAPCWWWWFGIRKTAPACKKGTFVHDYRGGAAPPLLGTALTCESVQQCSVPCIIIIIVIFIIVVIIFIELFGTGSNQPAMHMTVPLITMLSTISDAQHRKLWRAGCWTPASPRYPCIIDVRPYLFDTSVYAPLRPYISTPDKNQIKCPLRGQSAMPALRVGSSQNAAHI